MKKLNIRVIIVLLCCSLAAIFVLQALWIIRAWENREDNFNRDVQSAMNHVVERVERAEALSLIGRQYNLEDTTELHSPVVDTSRLADGMVHPNSRDYVLSNDSSHFPLQVTTYSHGGDSMNQSSSRSNADQKTLSRRLKIKTRQLNDVVQHLVRDYYTTNRPIENRISADSLYTIINQELNKKGINLPFQFGVVTGKNDSLSKVKSNSFSPNMIPTAYKATLFPNDLVTSTYYLVLYFSNIKPYVFQSMWWIWMLSTMFSILITATFVLTVYVIVRQKKISEIKTDFINNMSHELKTPLATISLAVDAINNPKVVEDTNRIKYYSGIISRENERMNAQVENILQMALLDKDNFRLHEQLVNVHSLIQRTVEPFNLQVMQRNGSINLNLAAANPYIVADEVHLTNVIINLLDNANKYSPQEPTIKIRTHNEKSGIIITIEDHGLGMTTETKKKIFDRFYRGHSGNIHNIKGFGLGLAYVRNIIKKHEGKITVHTELNKGSRFDLFLPYGHQNKQSLNGQETENFVD